MLFVSLGIVCIGIDAVVVLHALRSSFRSACIRRAACFLARISTGSEVENLLLLLRRCDSLPF